jgi:hypothetical protein
MNGLSRAPVKWRSWRNLLILLGVFAVTSLFFLLGRTPRAATSEAIQDQNKLHAILATQLKDQGARSVERKSRPKEEPGRSTAGSAKEELIALIEDLEYNRSYLIEDFPRESESSYVVGLKKPDNDEIAYLRRRIAAIQKSILPEEVQDFDHWMDTTIRQYDPFGTKGNQVIFIQIETEGSYGIIFPMEDPEKIRGKLSPANNVPYKIAGANVYSTSDKKAIGRFKRWMR